MVDASDGSSSANTVALSANVFRKNYQVHILLVLTFALIPAGVQPLMTVLQSDGTNI